MAYCIVLPSELSRQPQATRLNTNKGRHNSLPSLHALSAFLYLNVRGCQRTLTSAIPILMCDIARQSTVSKSGDS